MPSIRPRSLLAVCAASLLVACASGPQEATVQVYTPQPQIAAGTTYRHERLPSQAADARQAELEAYADAAMARAGLRRNDAAAQLAVQLTAMQDRMAGPGYGYGSPSIGIGVGGGSGGGGIGVGFGFPIGGMGVRSSQRVDVQVREVGNGRVVFQSQASGSSAASPALLLEAALRDFPNSQPGTRQVPLAAGPSR